MYGYAERQGESVASFRRDGHGTVGNVVWPGRGQTTLWRGIAGGPGRRSAQSRYAPGADLYGDYSHVHGLQHPGHVRPASLSQDHRGPGAILDGLWRRHDVDLYVAPGGEVP